MSIPSVVRAWADLRYVETVQPENRDLYNLTVHVEIAEPMAQNDCRVEFFESEGVDGIYLDAMTDEQIDRLVYNETYRLQEAIDEMGIYWPDEVRVTRNFEELRGCA